MFFEFHSDICFVKCQATKEILLQGTIKHGLYCFGDILHLTSSNALAACLTSTKNSDLQLWHSKLGHPAVSVVSKVLKSCQIAFSVLNSICCACCLGKSHQLPFPYRCLGPCSHSINKWCKILCSFSWCIFQAYLDLFVA